MSKSTKVTKTLINGVELPVVSAETQPAPFLTPEEEAGIKGESCYFVMQTEQDADGKYIALIAKEGESGYYRTDWLWGADFALAQQCADEMNERMGINKR